MQKQFYLGIAVSMVLYIAGSAGFSHIFAFGYEENSGLILAGILALLNVVAAFLIILKTINKDFNAFVRVFIGGIVIRMGVMLAVIFIIFKFMAIDNFVFIFSLFILYFIFQIWELTIINKHLKQE